MVATIGKLDQNLLKQFDIKQEVFYAELNWDILISLLSRQEHIYKPVAKFPSVRRDLALIIDKNTRFEELKKKAFDMEGRILKSVSIFDIYEGDKIPEGKKSYALSFILQDEEKTLTDKVIDKIMRRISQSFKSEFSAELR
jgi:phenylalanyl-tRNA synthetase beta chain